MLVGSALPEATAATGTMGICSPVLRHRCRGSYVCVTVPFREDLWVREGKILNPEKLFFDEKGSADIQLDCKDSIIAPGFIDVQIHGTRGWRVPGVSITDLQTLPMNKCFSAAQGRCESPN